MADNYKLTEEIKQFIIEQKKANPKLSCRGLIPLIKERFQVNLSKSLINSVLKESNLSSPRGRRRVAGPAIPKQAPGVEITAKGESIIKQAPEPTITIKEGPILKPALEPAISIKETFMENGGCFFLKAADCKLFLTVSLSKYLSGYFPNFPAEELQKMNEALIYLPLFKRKESFWGFLEQEISEESLAQYSQDLAKIPILELKEALREAAFDYNFNEIKDLHQQCLLELNAYVERVFFPAAYKFLDLWGMQERLYCLKARIEKGRGFWRIHLFYPPAFLWQNDIVWQEDFAYAAHKVNEAKILTPQKEQIWISPHPAVLDNAAL